MNVDFSGYDRIHWQPRTNDGHRTDCSKILSCTTKSSVRETEAYYGVRPCALLELPYYEPIHFVAIDIMHNLFLGTPKHMFNWWIENGIISKQHS